MLEGLEEERSMKERERGGVKEGGRVREGGRERREWTVCDHILLRFVSLDLLEAPAKKEAPHMAWTVFPRYGTRFSMNHPGREKEKDVEHLEMKTNDTTNSRSENVADMLNEFSKETSLHGLRHVNDGRKYRLRWWVGYTLYFYCLNLLPNLFLLGRSNSSIHEPITPNLHGPASRVALCVIT